MKRDNDLIREILLAIEAQHPSRKVFSLDELDTSCSDPHVLYEHGQLLIEDGFVDGSAIPVFGPKAGIVAIRRLTSKGHDFLANIRDDGVWHKVVRKVGTASLQVMHSVATQIATSRALDI